MLKLRFIFVYIVNGLAAAACGSVSTIQPDAPPDSPAPIDGSDAGGRRIQFEIIYVSSISVTASLFTAFDMGVVINRGTTPLDLSTARVISSLDNHPEATFEMTVSPSMAALNANYAAGELSPAAQQLIVDSGVATEIRTDQTYSMAIALRNTPDGEYTVNGSATLELGGLQVELPLQFSHGTSISFDGINRVLSKSLDQ